MTLSSLSTLFLLLVLTMAVAVLEILRRTFSGRSRFVAMGFFVLWLLYVGAIGYAGVTTWTRPPGLLFLVIPIALFQSLVLTRHPQVPLLAKRVPLVLLIGLQVFRVLVEGELYGLYMLGLVPKMLTFEGANLDILTGLSAPLVAWLYATGRLSLRGLRLWNLVGIALLTNVVVRAVLTLPGSTLLLHTEVPNRALGMPPFMFLPGFFVPLALGLHIVALRAPSTVERTNS